MNETNLNGDYFWQVKFVTSNLWKIKAIQDQNHLSPNYGCFDYSYWRDKTADFPDVRKQEIGAAIGLLLHQKIQSNLHNSKQSTGLTMPKTSR